MTVTDAAYQTVSTYLVLYVLPAGVSLLGESRGTSLTGAPITVGGSGSGTPPLTASTGGGAGTVTLADFSGDPTGTPVPGSGSTAYHDVNLSPGNSFTSIAVAFCDQLGASTAYWWTGSAWQTVSNQTYESATGCVAVTIDASTSPTLAELGGQASRWRAVPAISDPPRSWAGCRGTNTWAT